MNLYVSACVFKGIQAIVISDSDGKVVLESVSRDADARNNVFESTLDVFTLALSKLNMYIEEHSEVDFVTFESDNKSFVDRIERDNVPDKNFDSYFKFLSVLDNIPIRYQFVYRDTVKAKSFCKASNIQTPVVSGFNVEDFE